MCAAPNVDLPYEIHESIVQLFGSDVPTLLQLALVSRDYHGLSTKALYREIDIEMLTPRGEAMSRRLLRTLAEQPSLGDRARKLTIRRGHTEQQFRRMADNGQLIRSLPMDPSVIHLLDDPYDSEDKTIPSILAYFNQLDTLELTSPPGYRHPDKVCWGLFRRQFHRSLERIAQLPSLDTVRLTGISEVPEAWVTLLRAERIEFRDSSTHKTLPQFLSGSGTAVALDVQWSETRGRAGWCHRLRSLVLLTLPLDTKKYLVAGTFGQMETLVYDLAFKADIPILQGILNEARNTLKNLTVSTWRIFTPTHNAEPTLSLADRPGWQWKKEGSLDVSELHGLRTLFITVKTWVMSTEFGICESYDELSWALDVVRDVPSKPFESVSLMVAWEPSRAFTSCWRPQMWMGWDDVLARHASNKLRWVYVYLHNAPTWMELDNSVDQAYEPRVVNILDNLRLKILPTIDKLPRMLIAQAHVPTADM